MAASDPITAARFWSKVRVGPNAECWPWTATTSEGGYGRFQNHPAHRVAYEMIKGEVDPALYVLHRCDNRVCCNPAHLFLGTHQDNMDDMKAKGRGNAPRGLAHHKGKLSDDDVAAIRAAVGMTGKEMADFYGVAESTISQIRTFKTRVLCSQSAPIHRDTDIPTEDGAFKDTGFPQDSVVRPPRFERGTPGLGISLSHKQDQ